MPLTPWYKTVTPRQDLRDDKPLDAAEFAVHLDQVRDGRAPDDYQKPAHFFARTYLTKGLTDLAAEVLRRLSGERTETSAVFNLVTQFGGGKTHALTLLYHLAGAGETARAWPGVGRILAQAQVQTLPQARVAVFVGTEFDALKGRGGNDGTPLRKTPWGEIAFQLGGESALSILAEHEQAYIEPKGDVIRAFIPTDRPCLILLDEILNYCSTYRSLGYHNRLYNFIQALSETVRGMDNVVLVASLPKSEYEYTQDDEADQQRLEKMLSRLGKAVIMSADADTSEIIRRRLFEWDPQAITQDGRVMLPKDAHTTCQEYADWIVDHKTQLPGDFPVDNAREEFLSKYPFHPSVISVFERKWQVLPRFQRTRGVLRLLALWVARAYKAGYQGAHRDPLIDLGTAPLDDPLFRAAVFEQLGESRLEGAVTTDITGKKDSHALRLDDEAVETIRKARLHRKAATVVFFESNGGQSKAEATTPEIRLGVAAPTLDIGNVETVLESLRAACYYLTVEGNRYRFSTTPNLNKLLADRRANVQEPAILETVRNEVQKVFQEGTGLNRIYFPTNSSAIPDRPLLTLVILPPDQTMQDPDTERLLEKMTREAGLSGRTFKSALLWAIPEDTAQLRDETRKRLAWEDIEADFKSGKLRLDEIQERQLTENVKKANRDLREAVWRTYKNLALLGKNNTLRYTNLGLIHSSSATNLSGLILTRLKQDGEIEDGISPNFLLRHWPAFSEWSTRSVRDAFYASPDFPRLTNPDAIKDTIARGVSGGLLGYVGKTPSGDYAPLYFSQPLSAFDVEISAEMYLVSPETLTAYHQRKAAETPAPPPPIYPTTPDQTTPTPGPKEPDRAPFVPPSSPEPTPEPTNQQQTTLLTRLSWRGEIPSQKWMNFYTKVLSKFALGHKLKITLQMDVSQDAGISKQKVEETKVALRELGLGDEVETN